MPFKSQVPILQVESAAIHTVDTRSPEQLFGLWSIFAKCSDSLDEGKRLENLSWRLWNRETFCCAPDHPTPSSSLFDTPSWSFTRKGSDPGSMSVPALSSSLESDVSDDRVNSISTLQTTASARPQIRRLDSTESRNRGTEKHITPIDLESLVISIKEKKELEPLSPLPMPPPVPQMPSLCEKDEPRVEDTTPRSTAQPQMVPESSTSTVATAVDSDLSKLSPPVVGSDTSTSTDCSSHSVVRGFSPGRVSSSYRSKTNLQPTPQPIPTFNIAPQNTQPAPVQKKKGAMFTLGGSSDEGGDSSLETHMQMAQMRTNARSSLSDGLKKPIGARKQPSFEQLSSSKALAKAYENEDVFESDSDEEVSESAIEDDDEDQWEDSETDSGPASVEEKVSFQRVDSKPNLTSRRSLLTTLMHEGDRAQALQNAASQSTPALRRSKNTSPNGPSITASPTTNTLRYEPAPETNNNNNNNNNNIPRSKPIIMTTSNTHAAPPALSPRTTRRNMLTTELTESLRKHLLWERQQKNSTNNAVLKRRHTSTDVKNLKHYPGEPQPAPLPTLKENPAAKGNNSWTTNYFDSGLQEYHERGW